MARLIILVVLVVVVVWLVRRALFPRPPEDPASSRDDRGGRLVRCAHCGMYLPDGEAKGSAEMAYCTEEHARLGPRKL